MKMIGKNLLYGVMIDLESPQSGLQFFLSDHAHLQSNATLRLGCHVDTPEWRVRIGSNCLPGLGGADMLYPGAAYKRKCRIQPLR